MTGGFEDHAGVCEGTSSRAVQDVASTASLAVVYLQGCSLRCLPESMLRSCSNSLSYLLLSDNQLESLPDALSCLKSLRWLYLYGNRLRELPAGLLTGCENVETCLLEGNPLAASAVDSLLCDARIRAEITDRSERLRVVGLDAAQIHRWRADMMAGKVADPQDAFQAIPACVQVGWVVSPGGRWYGKLIPSSQMCRAHGDPVLGDRDGEDRPPQDRKDRVLMVALAASQAEPEWAGALGKLHARRHHRQALRDYGDRRRLDEHVASVFAVRPHLGTGDSSLMSTLWSEFNEPPSGVSEGSFAAVVEEDGVHDDFDVLLLVDPFRRWYKDGQSATAPLNCGSFLNDFVAMTAGYGRVCVLGASMGGFAALSCAHLADAVLAFGPQIDLESAPYRPGFETEALKEATQRLRLAVACRRGSVECHTSMDAHLFQATHLHPLPDGDAHEESESKEPEDLASGTRAHHLRLVIHPFKGRCARVLEAAGLLSPLLAQTLARLQNEVGLDVDARVRGSTEHASTPDTTAEHEWPNWSWPGCGVPNSGEDVVGPSLLVACWRNWIKCGAAWLPPAMRLLRATPSDVRKLAQHAPYPGNWFCPCCGVANEHRQPRCGNCEKFHVLEAAEARVVVLPGGDGPPFRRGDWECSWCKCLQYRRESSCSQCRRAKADAIVTGSTDLRCANSRCWTPAAELAKQEPLLAHPNDGLEYCQGCWRVWDRKVGKQVACSA